MLQVTKTTFSTFASDVVHHNTHTTCGLQHTMPGYPKLTSNNNDISKVPWFTTWRFPHMGVPPSHHPFYVDFPWNKPSSELGVAPWLWNVLMNKKECSRSVPTRNVPLLLWDETSQQKPKHVTLMSRRSSQGFTTRGLKRNMVETCHKIFTTHVTTSPPKKRTAAIGFFWVFQGSTITWWGVSSCTSDMQAPKRHAAAPGFSLRGSTESTEMI